MKYFENPEIEIVHFDVVDVITSSPGNIGGNGTELPPDEWD